MNIEKMREAYESHIKAINPFADIDRDGDDYFDLDASRGWPTWKAAWQQSRAAIEIELPPPYPVPEDPEFAIDDSHMDAYHAANGMRHACSKFIEDAGLKVLS